MANRYWVGGNGTWDASSTANWSASSGGASGASAPVSVDAVIFDSGSGSGTCQVQTGATASTVVFNSATVLLNVNANFAITSSFTLTAGTIAMNSYAMTVSNFTSSNSNVRAINFGTGKVIVSGTGGGFPWGMGTITNLTVSGTPVVDLTYSGATGLTVSTGALAEASAISFNITAGTYALTFAFGSTYKNLNFTGFSGSLVSTNYTVFGDFTMSSTMTAPAGTSTITFGGTNVTPRVITSAGVTIDQNVAFNGVGGAWSFADAFFVGATRTLTLTNGTLDANNKNVSIGSFALGSGTKTLALGSGTWTVAGANWNANTNVTGLTVSASTGVISMTSGSVKTFAGGGKTWPTLNQGGTGALTVQQSNTFTNITNTVQPATITLTAGTTQTVSTFTASGTSGNLITLNSSSTGSRATLTDSGGANSVSYMDIKDIAATGYGEWQAYTSNGNVDSGNNVGWVFAAPPPLTASEYQVSFKSFTERRSF